VSAQEVAEGKMACQRGAVSRANVEVVGRRAHGSGEGFAARHTQVTFGLVAKWPQLADDRGQVTAASDDNIDVDDGLGGKCGDRSAANVLDPQREAAESVF
jgi:hypothetical protein